MSRGPSTRSLTTRTRVYSLFSPLFSFDGIEHPLRPLRSYAPPFVGSYLPKVMRPSCLNFLDFSLERGF